jgi:tetratricopeptide (TPR) repeat protein
LRHAQEHFLLGLEFYRTSGYREALREFEAALALAPSADIWFNIGRAHQQLGQYAQAIQALERYLRDRVDAPDAAAVRTQIRKLSERASALGERSAEARSFGSVRVYHATADAQVFVDGRPLAGAALAAPLLLPSGRHRFDVLERGRVPLHALLEVQPGLLTAAYADLPTTHVAHTLRASHGVDFALLGVAGAGAIVSATFGILSATQQADGRIDSAHAWARRADVALAGTALCALVAGVVYLALERGARTELLPAANDAR